MSYFITNGLIESKTTDTSTDIVYQSHTYSSSIVSNKNGSFTMKADYLGFYSSSIIAIARTYLSNGLFAVGYPATFDILNRDTNQTVTLTNNIPNNWVNPDISSNYRPISTYQSMNETTVNVIPDNVGVIEVVPQLSTGNTTSSAEKAIITTALVLGGGYVLYKIMKK